MTPGTVIDKLEVRVPKSTGFSGDFGRLYAHHKGDAKIFRQTQHYYRAGDLRELGHPAILHMYCVHGQTGDHKLELVDTGEMSFRMMQREVSRIFDVDPQRLGLMRIDLAADVPDVPVSWFRSHARVKWKQWANELGVLKEIGYTEMGRRTIETLYFGKKPNCIRIYDKISEWHRQYRQVLRRASDAAEVPSFADRFGYPADSVLTRVERQFGGGRVPAQLDSLGKLRRLVELNPFDRIELTSGSAAEPDIKGFEFIEFCAGMGLRSMAADLGIHRLRSLANKHSRGNAGRIWQRYEAFLPREGGIDSTQLLRCFRESVARQLAA